MFLSTGTNDLKIKPILINDVYGPKPTASAYKISPFHIRFQILINFKVLLP